MVIAKGIDIILSGEVYYILLYCALVALIIHLPILRFQSSYCSLQVSDCLTVGDMVFHIRYSISCRAHGVNYSSYFPIEWVCVIGYGYVILILTGQN